MKYFKDGNAEFVTYPPDSEVSEDDHGEEV